MSDTDSRRLERLVAEGDRDAAAALVAERVRTRTGYLLAWSASYYGAPEDAACIEARLPLDPEPGLRHRLWALPVSGLADVFELAGRRGLGPWRRRRGRVRDGSMTGGAMLVDLQAGTALALHTPYRVVRGGPIEQDSPVSAAPLEAIRVTARACGTCGGRRRVRDEYSTRHVCPNCGGTGDDPEPRNRAAPEAC